MKSIEIDNIRKFTSALFVGETFDSFCVTEASFSTLVDISIDGHINREFLGEEAVQDEKSDDTAVWKKLKPLCYEIIKGQKVPLRFKIVFIMPKTMTASFLAAEHLNSSPEDINGLFLNIKFESNKLSCTTGTSLKTFSLDKSVEEAWDRYAAEFLRQNGCL